MILTKQISHVFLSLLILSLAIAGVNASSLILHFLSDQVKTDKHTAVKPLFIHAQSKYKS